MPAISTTDRWCVCTCWTYEASLSGYDFDEVVSTHDTREQAQAERNRVSQDHLQDVNAEDRCWCIGVGIAPEPAPGYAPAPETGDEMEWADCVPSDFKALIEAEND